MWRGVRAASWTALRRRGLSAWGLFPLYFPLLEPARPLEILANRIVWSLGRRWHPAAFRRRWAWMRPLLREIVVRLLLLVGAAVTIALNWGTYIYGVNSDQVVETSLGYFINPLVTIMFGVVLLNERLRRSQWLAVGLGAVAVVVLTIDYGGLPWIALTLAFSFGTYGLIKKTVDMGALESLSVETGSALPPSFGIPGLLNVQGTSALQQEGIGQAALLVDDWAGHGHSAAVLRRSRHPHPTDLDRAAAVLRARAAVPDRCVDLQRADARLPSGSASRLVWCRPCNPCSRLGRRSSTRQAARSRRNRYRCTRGALGLADIGDPLRENDPPGRLDERQMRERLGEVAQMMIGVYIELLRVQAQRRSNAKQALHQVAGLLLLNDHSKCRDQPEGTDQERTFLASQAVIGLIGPIAQDEAAVGQTLRHGQHRAAQSRIVARPESENCREQNRCVERLRVVVLAHHALGRDSVGLNVGSDFLGGSAAK